MSEPPSFVIRASSFVISLTPHPCPLTPRSWLLSGAASADGLAIAARATDEARHVHAEAAARTSLGGSAGGRMRDARRRLLGIGFAEEAAAAAGNRPDRGPAHAQPGRDFSLRQL